MEKFFYKISFSMVFLMMMSFAVSAQKTITGTILEGETKEALIGATVQIKGTTTGTVTDIDGKYSIKAAEGDILVVSYTGFETKEMAVGSGNTVDINLMAGQTLDEIVVVGYGSQSEKEITSAVVQVGAEDFNQGPISDPAQLLQGKVAGLQIYNRGGDPNSQSTIRMRGLSTVGANVQPLIVIDGIIGASLDNVDPNDIESMTVLKDGSAAAIYGSRGSSGVIIVTTKTGTKGSGVKLSYNGQFGVSSRLSTVQNMSPDQFIAAGGADLRSKTDWIEEVTQPGTNMVHSLSAAGGIGANSTFRLSANVRNTDGILKNTGFDQFNTRLNFSTKALNDRLTIDFSSSLTNKEQQNGFNEALRYAVLYNPTAPILGANSPFTFNSAQFGGYFETLGLFDSFNPVALIELNRNEGHRREFNYGANFKYSILDNLSANFRISQQETDYSNEIYFPTTSLFGGNATSPLRKGEAEFYEENKSFSLYEGYMTYLLSSGTNDLTVTGGYSYQQDNFDNKTFTIGDFPDDSKDYSNILEASQDLQNGGFITANSNRSPDNKIIAFFGRANYTYDNAIFFNASIRREGSTKLGADNKWGWFPSIGAGVDLNRYLDLNGVDLFKFRVGYGVTGALPNDYGLSQQIRRIDNAPDGTVTSVLERAANKDLKWEQKAELNFGLEFGAGRFSGVLDVYTRDISDFIVERTIENTGEGDKQFQNGGVLKTNGVELALNYDVANNSKLKYTTGLVLSTYKTTLEDYAGAPNEVRGNLGSPGNNGTFMVLVKEGEEIGQIWGPEFSGKVDDEGKPIMVDLNGDGTLLVDQGSALAEGGDFKSLGSAIPDLELGWTNQIQIGDWSVNAFFRGAFGHSLINTFRAFYEPRVPTNSSYNFINTELAVDGLTTSRFSSLYVEKADFFKLDNLTISRSFNFDNSSIGSLRLSLIVQNAFVITSYTGADPEPSFTDTGDFSNGDRDPNFSDVLAPGIDRRSNYFSSRTISLGLNLNF